VQKGFRLADLKRVNCFLSKNVFTLGREYLKIYPSLAPFSSLSQKLMVKLNEVAFVGDAGVKVGIVMY